MVNPTARWKWAIGQVLRLYRVSFHPCGPVYINALGDQAQMFIRPCDGQLMNRMYTMVKLPDVQNG